MDKGDTKVVAIDIGASSGKAFIGELLDDFRLQLSEIHRFKNQPIRIDGHLCWNTESIFDDIVKSINKAEAVCSLDAVSIDTWGQDFVLFKKNKSQIFPQRHYRDASGSNVLEVISQKIPLMDVYRRTGTHPYEASTFCQLVVLGKIVEDCDSLLFTPDFYNYLLCGEKAAEYKITYKLNKGKNSTSNPKTYTGETEIKLKKPTRSGYHFVGWYTDSKYKQKIDVIEKGSKGGITLYAKWIKEVNPSAKAASLTALKGTKAKTITASANIANYVKSVDDYYYLLYVDSNSGKVKKAAAKVKKPEMSNGKVTFKLDISGHPEYTQGKFAVGVKKSKTAYTVISSKSYVSNPEKLSSNTAAYFVPKTKKGIQATNFSEVTDTKSKNVFFNLYISDLMRKDSGVETYKYNGKTYHFNGLYGYEYLVQQCNAKGIQVTAQISIDKNASTQSLTTGSSPYAETAYYGWNTDNAVTRQTMEAMFAYLGEKFGRNNCYISNWILGNEVNSASGYYYVGNVSFSKFISMYSEAFRCLYNAVRSSRGSSKVFICLDNCWNQKNAFSVCYSAKSTLDNFATKISEMQKNVNWNLAYHAYNQPLSDSRFWSGANASMFTSDANSTTFITMRNIDTLTSYVKSRYGSNTRVILSEQGFSSTGGQANQAAALAMAYYKAACNPMIDAFIVRSYKDEAHEVAQGLAMGLKDANGKKKTAFNVFSNMDSSNSLKYTEKVLSSQVGNWKAQIPGYNVKRISSMYRK